MNFNKCSEYEKTKLEIAGVKIENREYTKEEIEGLKFLVVDFIMNHSRKEIDKLNLEYNRIFEKIN